MKQKISTLIIAVCIAFGYVASAQIQPSASPELFKTLAQKDSLFFDAIFNTCSIDKAEAMLGKNYVFYHDQGLIGATTTQTREDFVDRLKERCDKPNDANNAVMKRKVVKGSMQVFAVSADEATQSGVQQFYRVGDDEDHLIEESKFTREWRKRDGEWKMERELDYLVNTKFNNAPLKGNTLYAEIAHMDSVLFGAYNAHNMAIVKETFDKSLEFYHDKGGLSNYDQTIASLTNALTTVKDIRRDLVPGSMEVYPINNYGAIEVGLHTFCHQENGQPNCGTFKFVHVWQKKDGVWKLTRVVSYDH